MNNEKQLYTPLESYRFIHDAIGSMSSMIKARKSGELKTEFLERIMLAVTEVNNCPMCSYAHTKIALEAGMSPTEIENMLSGVLFDVPKEDLPAILFAQHYADTRGKPSKESLRTLVRTYGLKKAKGILGGVQSIMVGNAYGIVFGSFKGRLKSEPDPRSNLFYEVIMISTLLPFVILALTHNLITNLRVYSPSSLKKSLT